MSIHAEVKRLFDYDPDTGLLTRKSNGKNDWGLSHGYKEVGFLGTSEYAHRIIWCWMTGDWPEKHIDHIDRDQTNNKWNNLRNVDHSTNLRNQHRSHSPDCGVYPRKGKWAVTFTRNGCTRHYGTFVTKEEAREVALKVKALDLETQT